MSSPVSMPKLIYWGHMRQTGYFLGYGHALQIRDAHSSLPCCRPGRPGGGQRHSSRRRPSRDVGVDLRRLGVQRELSQVVGASADRCGGGRYGRVLLRRG